MGTLVVLMLTDDYAGAVRISSGLRLERIEYYPSKRTAKLACMSYCSVHPMACCVMIMLGPKTDTVETECVRGRDCDKDSHAEHQAVSVALRVTGVLVSAVRASNKTQIGEGE